MNTLRDYTGFIFVDDFSSVLEEDATKYCTLHEFENCVRSCIDELASIKLNIDKSIKLTYEIRSNKKITAGIMPIDYHQYNFILDKAVLQEKNKDKWWKHIIYHELCHIAQLEYLENNAFIEFKNDKLLATDKNPDFVKSNLLEAGGHKGLWQIFAAKVNAELDLFVSLAPTLSKEYVTDILLENMLVDPLDIKHWHKGML